MAYAGAREKISSAGAQQQKREKQYGVKKQEI